MKTMSKKYSAEYLSWRDMTSRCYTKTNKDYKNYGGRGIAVCSRWKIFDLFLEDMGKRPTKKHTIDRIDNNGNYCKENCRWVPRSVQVRNTRANVLYMGEFAIDASRRLGGGTSLVSCRMTVGGWSKERAFTTPPRSKT